MVGHGAKSVRDYVKEVPNRRLAQTIDVVRGGAAKSAPGDHPLAVAQAAVADGTKDVEALPAAFQNLAGDRERKCLCIRIAGLARIQMGVFSQVAARHGFGQERPRRASVFEERALLQRLVLRLIVHILSARG